MSGAIPDPDNAPGELLDDLARLPRIFWREEPGGFFETMGTAERVAALQQDLRLQGLDDSVRCMLRREATGTWNLYFTPIDPRWKGYGRNPAVADPQATRCVK